MRQNDFRDRSQDAQAVTSDRTAIAREVKATVPNDFRLSPEEMRLVMHVRALQFGELHVTVQKGKPMRAVRVHETIDYTKEVDFGLG